MCDTPSIFLAPMAGVTDHAFRVICQKYAPVITTTEMISSKALSFSDKKTKELFPHGDEAPMIVQIFGHEPDILASAAKRLAPLASWIDINMGCPAPKIVSNGDGSALMSKPDLAASLVSAVADAVDLPVSVKMRIKDTPEETVEFARLMESSGARRIAVHGRTPEQQYRGGADWQMIKCVKDALSVPVIGNGDIFTPEDGLKMLSQTGCDGIMVGRGATGNPFLLGRLFAFLSTGELLPAPTAEERIAQAIEHAKMLVDENGERGGVLKSRKHIAWYLKSIPGASGIKTEIFAATTLKEVEAALNKIKGSLVSLHQ